MNFGKGSTSGGRGTSFKGALAYVLHDKGRATTAERVGFVHLCNLPPVSPDRAWQEMKALANAADHIKERHARAAAIEAGTDPDEAAKKARAGRKSQKPVYSISLNWHPDESPTADHMREKALEVLRLLGLEDHQAVITQHTDEAHPHVHIVVNLVHPDTGKQNTLSNDEYKLDEWCAEYEIAAGVVRSPDRHKKHMEKLAKRSPRRHAEIVAKLGPGKAAEKDPAEKRTREKKTQPRDEWAARKNARNDHSAREAATAIKRETAEGFRRHRAKTAAAYTRRRAELNAAWNLYQKEKAAVTAAYKPQLDKVWKRPRRGELSALQRVRAAWADPRQALRDHRDRDEWRRFGRRQWRERRAFQANERRLLGVVSNAVRLARVTMEDGRTGRLSAMFQLMRDQEARRAAFDIQQEQAKTALRQRQSARKKLLAEPVTAARQADYEKAYEAFQQRRAEIEARHAGEIAQEKTEAAALTLKRRTAWQEWRTRYGIKPRSKYDFDRAARPADGREPTRKRGDTLDQWLKGGPRPAPQRSGTGGAFRDAVEGKTTPPAPQNPAGNDPADQFRQIFSDNAAGRNRPTDPGRERTRDTDPAPPPRRPDPKKD